MRRILCAVAVAAPPAVVGLAVLAFRAAGGFARALAALAIAAALTAAMLAVTGFLVLWVPPPFGGALLGLILSVCLALACLHGATADGKLAALTFAFAVAAFPVGVEAAMLAARSGAFATGRGGDDSLSNMLAFVIVAGATLSAFAPWRAIGSGTLARFRGIPTRVRGLALEVRDCGHRAALACAGEEGRTAGEVPVARG